MKKKKYNFNFIFGIVLLTFTLVPAIVGLFWTPYNPETMDKSLKMAGASFKHIYGCDNFGRDIFSRIMSGSSITVVVALGTVICGSVVGTIIGALTGYYGGVLDEALMRINDVALAFPSILLALVMVAVLGSGKNQVMLALGIAFIPSYARIVRSEYIRIKNLDYIKSAKLAGASDLRIMFVHILPNAKTVILSSVMIGFNNAVLAEAGLSFLGIGVQPPDASLGRMLSEAQSHMFTNPGYALFTGCTIVAIILGFSLLSKEVK